MKDKTIIVTGGGGRLGRRVVRDFHNAGAFVIAAVLDEVEARRVPNSASDRVEIVEIDTHDESAVRNGFMAIGERHPTISGLVHTVGGWQSMPFAATSMTDWDSMLRLNLTSTFLCFRAALTLMDDSFGRLIAIASRQGADRGVAMQAAYSASKAGIVRLVQSVAAEYTDTGITAHAVAPSTLLFDEPESGAGVWADDVARLCVFLFTDPAAALNGQVLRAYGNSIR